MELLPTPQQRGWLTDELARLVLEVGAETLVAAPVLRPDDRSFPDRWQPDVRGVHRLARRLMTYAGLAELDLSLELDRFAETTTTDARGLAAGHSGTAAWFAGIDDRTAVFGVDVGQLDEPQVLAGTLAHEVAHAYRAFHELARPRRDLEERLTDLTTIYLGFGILTCNASLQFKTGGDGSVAWWKTHSGGYLSPQEMSYALALQAVARGDTTIVRHLGANQTACFRAACASLDRDALISRLGLGLPSLWPSVRPLPEVALDEPALGAPTPAADEPVDHHPVFRLARSMAHPSWMRGALALGLAALGAIALLHSVALGVAALLAVLVLAGVLAALGVGPRRRWDACADPQCGAEQPRDAFVCPGCHRLIAGRVNHANERLEAAEAWERSQP